MFEEGYTNNPIFPCVFIKGSKIEFVIIVIYVYDLNIIETLVELQNVVSCFKKIELSDFGKTKFNLGLQIKHLKD